MTAFASGLYAGAVTHRRFRPKTHRLRYSMFQMLFDLDETPSLARRLRLFSHNRFNLFSFFDRDHGDGRAGPLRAWVEETCAAAGIDLEGGPVRLLCMPRLLGHVFNPLSLYYCHRRDGTLAAMLYEVNNTFGERHSYLIAAVFLGRRRELTDRVLVHALFAYPLLTLKVVAAIHFEALKLVLKGVRPRPRPPAPARTVTVG